MQNGTERESQCLQNRQVKVSMRNISRCECNLYDAMFDT